MSKPVPPHEPYYYGILADAAYENDQAASESYIKSHFPDAQVLDTKSTCLFWKYILVKRGDELTVAFRGTKSLLFETVPNIATQYADPTAILASINADLYEWEEEHGKITVLTGHSKGGYLATHVKKTADVFHIVFNGQKSQLGDKNINLRTENDILHMLYASFKGRSICIGPGYHGIRKYVLPNLKGRTWEDIRGLSQQPEKIEPSLLLTSIEGLEAATTEIADQLDQDRPVIDDACIQNLDDLSEASSQVSAELEREWKQNSNYYREVVGCSEVIAIEVLGFMQAQEQDRYASQQIKNSDRQLKRIKQRDERNRELQENDSNFHQLESRLAHSLNPNGIGHTVREINGFVEQYKKDVQLLKECLQKNRQAGETLEQQLQDLDKLDGETKEYYRKLRKSQKKLSKRLSFFSRILNTTTGILARIPMIHPGVMMAAGATQMVNPFLGGALARKQAKIENKRQREIERNIDIRQRTVAVYAQIGSQRTHLLEQQQHLQELLLRRSDLFDPANHMEALGESVGQLSSELQDINRKLAEKQGALAAQRQAVSNSEVAKADQTRRVCAIKKKKVKKKAQAQHVLNGISAKLIEHQTQAVALEQEVQTLESLKKKNEEVLAETQKSFDESQYVAPLRLHTWEMIVREETRWTPTDEKTRMLQVHIQQNFRLYADARLNERQIVDALMTATMAFTNELERMKGYSWPNQVASLSSHLAQLYDLQKYWKDFALPQLEMIKSNYSGGSWTNVREVVGTGTFLLQFGVPALRTLTLGLGCLRMGWNLYRLAKSNFEPQSTIRDRLPGYLKELVPADLEQLPLEVELHLQALGLTMKHFQALLDENFAFLHEKLQGQHVKVMGELDKVRTGLGILGKHLLSEIEASKSQIILKLDESAYNQYIDRVKLVEQGLLDTTIADRRRLESAKDVNERTALLLTFLTNVEIGLEKTAADHNNGLNIGHSLRGNSLQPYPTVDIALAHRNPAHVTGLLTASLGIEGGVPNWQLLETITQGFLETILSIAKDATYLNILKTDQKVRTLLSRVYSLISEQQNELDRLSEQLPILIQHVCEQQRMLGHELIRRTQMVRSIKAQYISKAQNEALSYYTPTRQRVLTDDFVGSSKFFLYQTFVEQGLPIPAWDFSKLYFQDARMTTRLRRRVPLMAGTALNAAVTAATAYFTLSVYQPNGDLTVNSATPRIIDRSTEDKITLNQLLIESIMKKSLRSLQRRALREAKQTKSPTIVFLTLPDADGQAVVSLDLKQRKLVCLTPTESTRPVLNLYVNTSQPQLGVELRKDSLIQLADLQKIPEPGYAQKDAAEYDSAVKTLMEKYLNFLDKAVEEPPAAGMSEVNNPVRSNEQNTSLEPVVSSSSASTIPQTATDYSFQHIEKSSQIVTGIREQLIPLALPKNLIEALEEQMNPELRYLEATGVGMMIPFYDFSTEDCKLTIVYRFVSLENPSESNDYCKFTIAQFNQSAVNAFQKDLRSTNGVGNTTEFLVQALYGSFGSNLGLPGQGSEIVSSGLIAPEEVSFIGLYRLWERFPDSMINYQSSNYTEALSRNLKKAVCNEQTDGAPLAAIIRPRQSPEFCKDYIDIWSKIYALKNETKEVESEFKSGFYLLLAMVKLLSGIDNKTLFGQLDLKLNLLPPEQQAGLADRAIEEEQLTKVPDNRVDLFVKLLSTVPSDRVRRLRLHFQKLIELDQLLSKA